MAHQVASTGRSTALALPGSDVPAVLDFDEQNPTTATTSTTTDSPTS